MNPHHPFDLVIGLDRSDRKADLCYIDTRTARLTKATIDTAPERLHDWLAQLRQEHPTGRVAVCLVQPATNLILFIENYSWITLYAIIPSHCKSSVKRLSPAGPRTMAKMRSIWPIFY